MTGRDEILLKELIKTTKNPSVKIQSDRQPNARQKTAHLTVALWLSCSTFYTINQLNGRKIN